MVRCRGPRGNGPPFGTLLNVWHPVSYGTEFVARSHTRRLMPISSLLSGYLECGRRVTSILVCCVRKDESQQNILKAAYLETDEAIGLRGDSARMPSIFHPQK